MKKLKNFQKFALSAEQASKVKGGIRCKHTGGGLDWEFASVTNAYLHCLTDDKCIGCF